ncbi:MAG TPA: class I SAM-dependent methyltransferase [Anaerolineales bacterium]|nr:class I SAM-dependent methyltransferase [Anaerolineales bacterium]
MEAVKTKKGYKGVGMEGPIASWYAKITLKDLNRHQLMARQLAQKIPPNGKVLEIAPGPGYFCIELARLGAYQITGLDISKSFVEIARRNAAAAGTQIEFRHGNASAMPFEDGIFDFTFCQAAFKNFTEPVKAIAEMYRVLRPGGTAVIVDLRRDASAPEIEHEIKGMGLRGLDEVMTRGAFKLMLLKSAYSVAEMETMIAQTSFGRAKIDRSDIGFQVWMVK